MAKNRLGSSAVEPDAWGVRRNGLVDCVAHRSSRKSAEGSAEQWGGIVVPLYSAPQPAKGWLTADEREALEFLASLDQGQYLDGPRKHARVAKALLARSSPPEVVLPLVATWNMDGHAMLRRAEVQEVLAAAGVTVTMPPGPEGVS